MSDHDGPQFIDTNVLVYAHDVSAGQKQVRAAALIDELWASGQGCLSIQVLQEFYVTVTRKVQHPLSPQIAVRIVSDLSTWMVHRPSVNDVLDAIRLQEVHQVSFWDAMLLASAMHLGCGIVWSEDLNVGQRYGHVVVHSPF